VGGSDPPNPLLTLKGKRESQSAPGKVPRGAPSRMLPVACLSEQRSSGRLVQELGGERGGREKRGNITLRGYPEKRKKTFENLRETDCVELGVKKGKKMLLGPLAYQRGNRRVGMEREGVGSEQKTGQKGNGSLGHHAAQEDLLRKEVGTKAKHDLLP